MKTTYARMVGVCTISFLMSNVLGSVESGSFFEADADLGRIQRNLLQTEDENEPGKLDNEDTVDATTEEPRVERNWDLFTPNEDKLGS